MSKSMLKSKLIKFTGLILTVFMMVGFLPVSHAVMAAKQQRTLQHMECTANGFYKGADGYYYLNDLHAEYMWSNGLQPGRLGIGSSEAFTDEACTRKVNAPLGYNSDYYVIVYLYCSKNEYTRFFAYSSFKLDVEGFTAEYVDYEEKTDSSGYQEFWIKCKVRRTENAYVHTPSQVTVETTYFKFDRDRSTNTFGFTSSVKWKNGETFTNYQIELSDIYVDQDCTKTYFDYDSLESDGVYYIKLTFRNATPNDSRIKLFGNDMNFTFKCENRPVTCIRSTFCVDEKQRESVTYTYRIGKSADFIIYGVEVSADSIKQDSYYSHAYLENPEITVHWNGNAPSRVNTSASLYADKECTQLLSNNYGSIGTNYYIKVEVSIPRGNNLQAVQVKNANYIAHMANYASGVKSATLSTAGNSEILTVVIEVTKIAIVYFNTNGHGNVSSSYTTLYEPGLVKEPTAPTENGYVFCGWYKDKDGNVPFDFSTDFIYYTTVLYAKWIKTPAFTTQPKSGTADEADGNYYVNWETNFDALYYEVLAVDGANEMPIKFVDEVDLDGGKTGFANIGMFNQSYEGTYIIRGYYSDYQGEKHVDSKPFTVVNPVECKVYFRINCGTYSNSSYRICTVVYNNKVERPINPVTASGVPSSYVFLGWYAEPLCVNEFDFSKPIKGDTNVYAKWAEGVTVAFDCSGATGSNFTAPVKQKFEIGKTAANPWPDGFSTPDGKWKFVGWYSDAKLTKKYDFSSPVYSNITLYAKWEYTGTYKVTVKANGYGYDKTFTVNAGQKFTRPADPSDSRNTHLGYYTDAACTQAYDFTKPVNGNLTLYNKWVKNPAVFFDMNDGSGFTDTRFFRYNTAPKDSITFPVPEYDGRTLAGWYKDPDCTVEFTGDEALTENITVYAKWNWEYYTISFDTQGGSEVLSQTIRYGEYITAPETPVREGYLFTGWYNDAECTSQTYLVSAVVSDCCYYAGWEKRMYPITLINEGNGSATLSATRAGIGDEVTVTVDSGEVESVLVKYNSGVVEIEVDITNSMSFTMPANEVTVKVIYKEKVYTVHVDVEGEGGRAQTLYQGPAGTEITLDYIVEEGYELKEWKIIEGDVTIENDKFTIGTSDVKLVAVFGPIVTGEWVKGQNGWWYKNPDGSYPASQWMEIDGDWYYFNASGYMVTGWNLINGRRYYLGYDGAMRTHWQTIGKKTYYFGSDGAMRTGWQQFEEDWFYFDENGAMQTGWVKSNGKWYYTDEDGIMCTGFRWIDDAHYYFDSEGIMKTGWLEFEDSWFYFGSDGKGATGWLTVNGKQYYFKKGGLMAASEYIDGYWLNADGTWTYKYRAEWRHNSKGWWYGDESGWFAKNEVLTIDGVEYAFDYEGYCLNP